MAYRFLLNGSMRDSERCNRAPTKDFFDDGLNVRQMREVVRTRSTINPNNRVDLSLERAYS